ncbi:MAG: rhamnulokinase [Gemmatimonadetes bacterium]|nr:rhamnulokinase [Gemmatimonadota bacterium]
MRELASHLAFDLGAASGRAVLGTLDGDAMALEVVHRFSTPVLERDGHLSWDIDAIWEELRAGLAAALQASPRLRSLSVDSWAVDYVPLAADGRPVRPPYCYRDPRTNGVMERAFRTMPPETIYAHTGIQFLPFNTLFQLLADAAEHGGGDARVHRYLPIADYFNYRFGGRAVVELSMASTTQLLDVHTHQWAAPVFAAFGLDAARWPPIVPSGTRLGQAHEAPEVAVVASCSHDTGCAVAAVPARLGRWAFVSSGTWSLLGLERRAPQLTAAARAAGIAHEAGADGTIRFLKNLTGLWALQECVREWGDVAWGTLEAEARAAPPGTVAIDLEDPRFLPRGGMAERLRAWCREHGHPVPATRGALVRVILESIAVSYARALRELQRVTGDAIEVLHIVGGGSQNRLLCQLAADACGIKVVAGPAEATALGNLLLQARTLGGMAAGVTTHHAAARSSKLAYHTPSQPSMEAHVSNA